MQKHNPSFRGALCLHARLRLEDGGAQFPFSLSQFCQIPAEIDKAVDTGEGGVLVPACWVL